MHSDNDPMIGFVELPAALEQAGVLLDNDDEWVMQAQAHAHDPSAVKRAGHYGIVPVMVYYCIVNGEASCGTYIVDSKDGERGIISLTLAGADAPWVLARCLIAEYLIGKPLS